MMQVLQLMMTMFRVETCTDPCGLNWSDEAASPAADDDYVYNLNVVRCSLEGVQLFFERYGFK